MASWEQRCSTLFEDLRKPARVLVGRAYGSALSPEAVEDVYSNAWTSSLAALGRRAHRMSDDELRSYLLTAVANHASKEMRRRSRKPTSALEESHAQTVADDHAVGPEDSVLSAELSSATRDVLSSLPPRRRAVILFRYGWGLDPEQVRALVGGLSPRAYRKEITRGVQQMIERLGELESGAWCESREPILREFVAGTCSDGERRQAVQHLGHCRACAELVARMQGHLHELGGAVAWSSLTGVFGERELSLGERALAAVERGRESIQQVFERVGDSGASEAAATVASSGGARGAGAAGAGALAKLGGLGVAGKATVACLGAGAAASVCVAAGVGPLAVVGDGGERPSERESPRVAREQHGEPAAADPALIASAPTLAPRPAATTGGAREKGERQVDAEAAEPEAQRAPVAEPESLEFGLAPPGPTGSAPAEAAAAPAGGRGTGASGGGSGGPAAGEFGGP